MFLIDRKQYEQVGAGGHTACSGAWNGVMACVLQRLLLQRWPISCVLHMRIGGVRSGCVGAARSRSLLQASRPCLLHMTCSLVPFDPPQAQAVAGSAVERLSGLNRRTLDVLGARIYSYLSLAHERLGECHMLIEAGKRGCCAA